MPGQAKRSKRPGFPIEELHIYGYDTVENSCTVSFKYDPFGKRIYKSSSSATSIFAYDGNNLVEETNSSGSAVARYSQGLSIDEPLAMLRSGATSFYDMDGLGSVTSLSTPAGALANTYTYDSFGNLTASTGLLTNSFRYTGREFDTETSLYYYRARYLDPQIGRFTREDPIRFGGGDSNFYNYVSQSPVNYTDPSGRTRFYGNWCGSDWTGGIRESFNPKHWRQYKPPIDLKDETCMHHDICYFNCRSTYPCKADARANCFRTCDKIFIDEVPISFAGTFDPEGLGLWYPIALHFKPDPGSNLSCGCYNITPMK